MKVCIVQPYYPLDHSRAEEMFEWEMQAMLKCDPSMDLIVFPESSDVPVFAEKREVAMELSARFAPKLLERAAETAKRCGAHLFINCYRECETGYRNTTYAFDKNGVERGYYYKEHLTPGETTKRRLDSEYTFEPTEPTIVEMDGIRYGFLTCYDFYFYENFASIARYSPDIIIGCSHQRSDSHAALEMMSRFVAYNTNAYVVRSSVSLDESGSIGGGSMVVSPEGKVLLNMESRVGMECTEIDPEKKYLKPGGFGNPLMAHHEYIEKGRRPWKYRPAGPAIARTDALMPYPRVCAHRGWNAVAPENSMPAFASAIALGAEEIEFDLWVTTDGVLVSTHDPVLERVSDGEGRVDTKSYAELLELDFGAKFGEKFRGLRILTFEQILEKLACHAVMNIHLKTRSDFDTWSDESILEMVRLIRKYDCEKHVYFMTGNEPMLEKLCELAPNITRCAGAGNDAYAIVDRAIRFGCKKLQLFNDKFDQAMIDRAHEHGIICNVCQANNQEKAQRYLDMGIDTILTNEYLLITQVVDKAEKYTKY